VLKAGWSAEPQAYNDSRGAGGSPPARPHALAID